MKRDMELIRRILMEIESNDSREFHYDRQDQLLIYHLKILHQAKYIDALDTSTFDAISFYITGLTWQGHDFLDSIRHDSVWIKVKEKTKDLGTNIPLEVLKSVAIQVMTAAIMK